MSQDETLPPVLTASVHDVRYFAALLRGVNFVNRATLTVTERGITITVEEARTLLGRAFIFADLFDEYAYHPEPPAPRLRPQPRAKSKRQPQKQKQKLKKVPHPPPSSLASRQGLSETESESEVNDDDDDDDYQEEQDNEEQGELDGLSDNAAFEVPLNTLIECLNIFGTAGPATGVIGSSSNERTGPGGAGGGGRGRGRGRGGGAGAQGRGWHRGDNNDSDEENGGGAPRGLDLYFGVGASEKRTGMRLSYPGGGYPLTLIIAEDASGPTTTCEITTFDPEPHLELDFDNSKTVLKIILKSSWLRDALSELDPSCEKLTFVGNPPPDPQGNAPAVRPQRGQRIPVATPMLRIQATGTFGSTEMDYPNDRDVLETFECTRNVSFSYRFGHISRALRALQSSTKTSLRIDEEGLLSLQFLMPSPKARAVDGGADAFIEFRCLALDDDF